MSGELMLVQRAWLQAARFLRRGFDTTDLAEASAAIERVGPGAHFMADPSTLARLRTGEFFESELFDMEGGPAGEGASMLMRARVAADQLVAAHRAPHDQGTGQALRRFFRQECAAAM
jgi:trimethylamine:corrinoid methyltransferase-like protein